MSENKNGKSKTEVDIGDPYKKWLCDLENNLNYIGQLLFERQYKEVLRQEHRVVVMLNQKSKDALKPLKEKLDYWMFKSSKSTIQDLHQVHDELWSFLHENYLQENTGYRGIDPTKRLKHFD